MRLTNADLSGKNEKFVNKINSILRPHAFVMKKRSTTVLFHRPTAFGYNQVYLSMLVQDHSLLVTPFFYTRVNSINHIANPFLGCTQALYGFNPTIGANLRNFGVSQPVFHVKTPECLDEALSVFEGTLGEFVLPYFQKLCNVSALDAELNREDRPINLFLNDVIERPVVGTVAALLNRNKDYRHWVQYYRGRVKTSSDRIANNYDNLLTSLRVMQN